MDEKNNRTSFLDLLEHMKSYLWNAKKTGGEIEERQRSLTETAAKKEKDTEEKPDKDKADADKPDQDEPG